MQPSFGTAIQGLWSDFLLQIEQMSQRLQQTFQILSGTFPIFRPPISTTAPPFISSTAFSVTPQKLQEQDLGPATFPNVNDEINVKAQVLLDQGNFILSINVSYTRAHKFNSCIKLLFILNVNHVKYKCVNYH